MQHEKNCHEGVDLYSSLYECAHTCTLDVCHCVYPGTGAHDAETKDHHCISFLIILHLIFFEAESLAEAGAHSFGLTGLPVSSRDISYGCFPQNQSDRYLLALPMFYKAVEVRSSYSLS